MNSGTKEGLKSAGPMLIMVRGLPGSGKSHLSAALESTLGPSNVVVLDPDKVDTTNSNYQKFSKKLNEEGLDETIHPFRWLREKACRGVVERKIVIWNQPFTVSGVFDRLVAFIERSAYDNGLNLPVLVVEVNIDHQTAKKRIDTRRSSGGHGPSDSTFSQRVSEYVSFSDRYNTIEIDGDKSVEDSVHSIVDKLRTMLEN